MLMLLYVQKANAQNVKQILTVIILECISVSVGDVWTALQISIVGNQRHCPWSKGKFIVTQNLNNTCVQNAKTHLNYVVNLIETVVILLKAQSVILRYQHVGHVQLILLVNSSD